MEKFVIEGGVPLSGTMVPAGNKNGALPILASALLTEDEVLVRNVPRIRDVEAMLDILRALGVSVSWRGPNEVALCAATAREIALERELSETIRASFLLAGPLLARFRRAVMAPPGGDVIGRRRLDPHLDAFRARGADVECNGTIALEAPRGLRPTDVFMDEPSVMATENVLMAAALTPGTTVIGNAASEPHVQDLARMLVKMGADIHGIGSNLITVNGAERLHGCEHDVAPDHIEIGSFMALAGVTGGELRIKDTVPGDLRMIRLVFERLGLRSVLDGNDVIVPGGQKLVAQSDVGEFKSKIQDGPWPAFPADLTSIEVALATQAEG
ncbi:MAG TPA: UDP-N-acetylglucosamine 1-carboxyvinyltransferase, partial [Solirubrobacteraceae bacterium]